jgi:hypothetical protein
MPVHLHLFISRIGVICNALFVYCFVVRHTKDFIGNQDINSIIITLGWGASFILNILLNLSWLLLFIFKKKIDVPMWILLLNLVMFIFQIGYLAFILF